MRAGRPMRLSRLYRAVTEHARNRDPSPSFSSPSADVAATESHPHNTSSPPQSTGGPLNCVIRQTNCSHYSLISFFSLCPPPIPHRIFSFQSHFSHFSSPSLLTPPCYFCFSSPFLIRPPPLQAPHLLPHATGGA